MVPGLRAVRSGFPFSAGQEISKLAKPPPLGSTHLPAHSVQGYCPRGKAVGA